MSCPDLDTIGRHLDGELALADEREVTVHVAACAACGREAQRLRGLALALGDRGLWPDASACLAGRDLLPALLDADAPPAVRAHVTRCSACQAELAGLGDVLLRHERGQLEAAPAGLKARLRRLAPGEASTVEELRPAAAPRDSRRTTARRASTAARAVTARASGAGALKDSKATGRLKDSKKDSRRGSRRTGRHLHLEAAPGAWGPTWAWGVLSAAAVLLVGLALALRAPEAGVRHDVARGPRPTTPPRRPLVSDLRDPAPRVAPAPAPTTPAVDPTYPLPDAEPPPTAAPGPVAPEQRAPEPAPLDVARAEPTPAEGPRAPDGDARDLGGTLARAPEPAPAPDARSTAAGPPAPEAAPESIPDDGGRLELALGRLAGGLALAQAGEATWQGLARADGVVSLRPGDRLRGKAGGAFLSLDGGAYEVALDQGAEVVVRAARGGPVLGLEQGRLIAEVAPLGPDGRFVVATRHGDFAVHGTVFAVEAAAQGAELLVAEGEVQASNGQGRASVPAGHGLAIAVNGPPGEVRPADVERGLAWANAVRPRREVLYAARMDDPRQLNGFAGVLSGEHGAEGQALVLEPLEGDRYWGLAARAPGHRVRQFRAASDLFVSFRLWSEKATDALLELTNQTQGGKPFKKALGVVPAARWTTFTVGFMELTTYFDPGKNPIRELDTLTDVGIYAGKPGERFEALVDEVVVYRKLYR